MLMMLKTSSVGTKDIKKEVFMTFTIFGDPQGKDRPRFTKRGFTYTPKKTKEYERKVVKAFISSPDSTHFTHSVTARIKGVFKIPASTSKKKRAELLNAPYTHRCDADNLAKIILDSLNGIAYDDDACVTTLIVTKVYGEEPRVEVILEENEM